MVVSTLVRSDRLAKDLEQGLEKLVLHRDGHTVYAAGLPNFDQNFNRDGLVAGLLMDDPALLRGQLAYDVLEQGKRSQPVGNEEPGKIPLSEDGFRPHSFRFNACDTTALDAVAHARYLALTGDRALISAHREALEASAGYIQRHLDDDHVFYDSPLFSGADRFELPVTYWKDSRLPGRQDGVPHYPVIYTLVHAQNLHGLRSLGQLLADDALTARAEAMAEALRTTLWSDREGFFIARDQDGAIYGASSDFLHILYHLEPGDLTVAQLAWIRERARPLETPIGYRALDPHMLAVSPYHSKTVWPFEQALIHAGATRFGWRDEAAVAQRVVDRLDVDLPEFREIYRVSANGTVEPQAVGATLQLWTLAARVYFERQERRF